MRTALYALIGCACIATFGCKKTTLPDADQTINEQIKSSLLAKYPDAQEVQWRTKNEYVIADFKLSSTRSAATTLNSAWFGHDGQWRMTETDTDKNALPEAVKTAFEQSEYSTWTIDDIDLLEREGATTVCVIEVEGMLDGARTEIDLYYSIDGILVKKVIDTDDDYDYEDYIPATPTAGIEAFIHQNHPNARILDIEEEEEGIEVDILDGKTYREILFNHAEEWLFTVTEEVAIDDIPSHIIAALKASEYGSFRIEEIDHYQTPSKTFFRFEMKSAKGDIDVEVTTDGTVSVATEGKPGSGTTNSTISAFIHQKYPNASIKESDNEDGLLEVKIVHENKEKKVYFNGSSSWVKTEWDVRYSELPQAVTDLLSASYNQYEIDDIEYFENDNSAYYRIELEGNNDRETTLRINANGEVL